MADDGARSSTGDARRPLDLDGILDSTVESSAKGWPAAVGGKRIRDIAAAGLNVARGDLPLPLLVLKRTALEHNLSVMRDYCTAHAALLAPHAKTAMAPQITSLQLEHGAWGVTTASVQQAEVYSSLGAERIMIANQVVGEAGLRYLADQLNTHAHRELYSWVDSAEGVGLLTEASINHQVNRPFDVLLELGWVGGRTGARTQEAVDAVVAAVSASRGRIRLVGVAVFEGLLQVATSSAALAAGSARGGDVGTFLKEVVATAERLASAGALPENYLLSGGGSTTFDTVAEVFAQAAQPARTLLRSGCYITHDHGMNADLSPLSQSSESAARHEVGTLRPALELWADVTSTPEEGLAFLGLGRRDAPYDCGFPSPIAYLPRGSSKLQPLRDDATVAGLNDQHCYVRVSGSQLRVGDRVVLGISHPCSAFDRWRLIPVVDDEYNVVDAIKTFF